MNLAFQQNVLIPVDLWGNNLIRYSVFIFISIYDGGVECLSPWTQIRSGFKMYYYRWLCTCYKSTCYSAAFRSHTDSSSLQSPLLLSHYHLFSHFGLNNKSLEISSLCWYSSVDTELFVMNFEGDSIIIALKIGPGR